MTAQITASPCKAVILARGLGTRMRQRDAQASLNAAQTRAADAGVKALMPIDRPFLDYVLHALAQAGFTQVCLVIGPEHQRVREYYEEQVRPHRLRIGFAVQPEPRGTADAVLAAEPFAGPDLFLTINADNYYPRQALDLLHACKEPAVALFDRAALLRGSNIEADRLARFAVAEVAPDGRLSRIIEKPDAATLARLGPKAPVSMNCWLFGPAIFAACRAIGPSPRGEYELTDAVQYAIDALHQRLRVLTVYAPVLDLSCRADVPAVAARLAGTEVDL